MGTEIRARIDRVSYYFSPGTCGRFSGNTSMIATVTMLENSGMWSVPLNVSLAQTFAYTSIGSPAQSPYVVVAAVFDACIYPTMDVAAPPLPECKKHAGTAVQNEWSSSSEVAMDQELSNLALVYGKTYSLSGWSFRSSANPIIITNDDGSTKELPRFLSFTTSTRTAARTPLMKYLYQLTGCGAMLGVSAQTAPVAPFIVTADLPSYTSSDPSFIDASTYDTAGGGRVAQSIPTIYGNPPCNPAMNATISNCGTVYAPSFEFILATPSDGALPGRGHSIPHHDRI